MFKFPPSTGDFGSTPSTAAATLFLSRFFGLFPYELKTFKRNYWVLPGAVILFCITVSLLGALGARTEFADPFVTIIYRVLNVVPWLSTIVFVWRSLCLGPQVSAVLEIFGKIKRCFALKRHPEGFRLIFIVDASIRFIIIVAEIYTAILFVRGMPIHTLLVRLFGLYLTHTIQNIYELQFLSFIHQTASWFTLLRLRLNVKTAVPLVNCYRDLAIACHILEKAYNVQNLVVISNCFVIIVVEFYNMYALVKTIASPLGMNFALRACLRSYQVLVLSLSVSRLCQKAEEFDEALYAVTLDDNSRTLANNEKVKLHLAKGFKIGFTGGRMFTFESTLPHWMAALVVNYLIILAQNGGKDHLASNN